jgi:hypothetical protein
MNTAGTKSTVNAILALANAILKTIKEEFYGTNVIRVLMETPSIWEVDVNVLTQALGLVLHSYKAKLPKNIADGIRALNPGPYTFEVANSSEGLRPRRFVIDLSPGKKILLIAGHPPVPGKDGFFVPFFQYDPSKEYRLEHLTFSDVISLPQVNHGQVIGKLFLPSQGSPGVTASGQRIEATPGAPYELIVGEGIATKRMLDPDEQLEYNELTAIYKGVIIPTISRSADSHKLIAIDVKNRLEIDEINCVACDKKMTFNCLPAIVVRGAMRGKSTFMFGSSLEVRGVIEGHSVHVNTSITKAPLTLTMEIADTLTAESIYNARIRSGNTILVKKDMLRVDLTALHIRVNSPGSYWDSLIGYVAMSADQVILERVNIRNMLELNIGKALFDKKALLEEKRKAINVLYKNNNEELKEKLTAINKKTDALKASTEIDMEARDAIQAVYGVIGHLLKKTCSVEQANKMVKIWIQNYGKRFFSIAKGLIALLKVFTEQKDVNNDLYEIENQISNINEKLKRLYVKITGYIGLSGKIIIRCAGQELQWENNTSFERENLIIELKYKPDKGLVAR